MSQHTIKAKNAVKLSIPRSNPLLSAKILSSLQKTAEIVGGTLGPFGQSVLCEPQDSNHKMYATKDGVTVYKNLGYDDVIEQAILEAARDAIVRTVEEAGDGSTSATILCYAITKYTREAIAKDRTIPPQKLVRAINAIVPTINSFVKNNRLVIDENNYEEALYKVGFLSANADGEIAKVIMECHNLVGDDGNMIVTEAYGEPATYNVLKHNGFTMDRGYEVSCERWHGEFINDPGNSRIYHEKPVYLLYDGVINDPSTISYALGSLAALYTSDTEKYPNAAVIIAHGFSESVLQFLAVNARHGDFKCVPLKTVQEVTLNSGTHYLHDIAAYTGAIVFNAISKPLQQATEAELLQGKSDAFEMARFRSSIIGEPDEFSVQVRVEELRRIVANGESSYDRRFAATRISKLTCGIAKVTVVAPSQVEIREKKDRMEDAWCAVRAAAKHGALPGGCWTLVHLSKFLHEQALASPDKATATACRVMSAACLEPFRTLYTNAGYNPEKIETMLTMMHLREQETFDLQNDKWVPKFDILDSAPAVLEALKNSISTSSLMGTLGGVVLFKRDGSADVENAVHQQHYLDSLRKVAEEERDA